MRENIYKTNFTAQGKRISIFKWIFSWIENVQWHYRGIYDASLNYFFKHRKSFYSAIHATMFETFTLSRISLLVFIMFSSVCLIVSNYLKATKQIEWRMNNFTYKWFPSKKEKIKLKLVYRHRQLHWQQITEFIVVIVYKVFQSILFYRICLPVI